MMDNDDLKEIGVTQLGPRKKLFAAIQAEAAAASGGATPA